jgi:hypothetical protein
MVNGIGLLLGGVGVEIRGSAEYNDYITAAAAAVVAAFQRE